MGPKRIILKSSSGSSTESVAPAKAQRDGSSSNGGRVTRGTRAAAGTAAGRRASPPRQASRRTEVRRAAPQKPSPPQRRKTSRPVAASPKKRSKADDPASDISLSLSEDESDESENENDDDDEDEEDKVGSEEDENGSEELSMSDDENSVSGKESDEELDSTATASISDSETESLPTGKLTARQRSLLQAESIESVPSMDSLSLPALTEEEQLRKSETSRRRAAQRDLKLEQSKADTIKRLLQKQSSRSKKMKLQEQAEETVVERKERIKTVTPKMIRHILNRDRALALLGTDMPGIAQGPRELPKAILCSAKGCSNPKKYLHSTLHRPVCSLHCYQSLK